MDLQGALTTLVNFTDNGATNKGAKPRGRLALGRDGNFYGLTEKGGRDGYGTTFQMTPQGVLTTLVEFIYPSTGPALASEPRYNHFTPDARGNLYAAVYTGGSQNAGAVIRINLNPTTPVLVVTGNSITIPHGETQTSTANLTDFGRVSVVDPAFAEQTFFASNVGEANLVLGSGAITVSPSTDFTVLSQVGTVGAGAGLGFRIAFNPTTPGVKTATVTLASNDPVTPAYTFTVQGTGQPVLPTVDLVTSLTTDFRYPQGSLLWGGDGFFYGMSQNGSTSLGNIFKMSRDGTVSLHHSFTELYGSLPRGGLIRDSQGNFYGLTPVGGTYNEGTLFKLDSEGNFTTLVSFAGTPGNFPGKRPVGALILDANGDLYGVTQQGGTDNKGTIFKYSLEDETFITVLQLADTTAAMPSGSLIQDSEGNFYGMTTAGGTQGRGTVFKLSPAGDFSVLVDFTYTSGENKGSSPYGSLLAGPDGHFYGTTSQGGVHNQGTLFKMTPQGVLTTLVEFNGTDGATPNNSLTLASDGNFYGMTVNGGSNNVGTVFQMTPDGLLTTLVHFTGTGTGPESAADPAASVFRADDRGNLYATTFRGGSNDFGTVLRINFAAPAPFIAASGNDEAISHGQTETSASDHTDFGIVSVVDPASAVHSFTLTNLGDADLTFGSNAVSVTSGLGFAITTQPDGTVVPGDSTTFSVTFNPTTPGVKTATVTVVSNDPATPAYTFTIQGTGQPALPSADLVSTFTADFTNPYGTLTWGGDGFFYGTTYRGSNSRGNIFKMSLDGRVTLLHTFGETEGAAPVGALARDSEGNLYGTTQVGGTNGLGTLFKLDPQGVFTTLVSFTGSTGDFLGSSPIGSLILDANGDLYGTTSEFNSGDSGTIFKYSLADGTFTTLFNFADTAAAKPMGGLIRDDEGNFYGTTAIGGSAGYGTVYKLSAEGDFSILVNFTGESGANKGSSPRGTLTLGPDGHFYGMTKERGSFSNGTIFKVTKEGIFTTLVEFTGSSGANPGGHPYGSLTLGPDGSFYGATSVGGTYGRGTAFQMTPEGLLTNLVHFRSSDTGPDAGSTPAYMQFALDHNGNLYGTTAYGGTATGNSYGTVFRINFAEVGPILRVTGNDIPLSNGQTQTSPADGTEMLLTLVAPGSYSSATFTLTNTGDTDLTFDPGAISVTGADFAPGNPPSLTIAPGASSIISINFSPTAPGVQTSTVTINSNDPFIPAFTFTLSAAGVTRPTVTATAVTGLGDQTATLNGTVNPNGLAASYNFVYSTDPAVIDNTTTTMSQSLTSGFDNAAATVSLTDLQPGTTYYYRLHASNQLGGVQTSIGSFTTTGGQDPDVIITTGTVLSADNGMPNGGAVYRPMPGVINNAGKVLFQAVGAVGSGTTPNLVTGSNDEWLMSDASGESMVILREGDQLGSNSGHYLSALFNHLLLGSEGQSFTSEKITGATTDKDYAYLTVPASGQYAEIVSQEGDSAPESGIFINSVGKPLLDSQNRFYFQGSLSGVATALATGVWYDNGEGLSTLVQAGQNISAEAGDPAWLGKVSNVLAAGGNGVSFVTALQANPANTKDKTDTLRSQAILSANVGAEGVELSFIARKGDSVSGGSTLNTINGLSRSTGEHHAFTALMKTGSNGVTTANDEILGTVVEGATVIIAREATTELAPGFTVKSFGDFYAIANGDVIFQAVLNAAPATTDGILCRWVATTGEIEILAREGDSAPGTGGLNYGTLHTVGVSDNGNIVLQTILSDGKHALHRNTGDGFELLVRAGTGQTVNFNGSSRNILSMSIYTKTTGTGGGGGGMGSAINDSGDVFAVLSIGSGDYVSRLYRGETPPPQPEPIP